jgi:hypothetical protein
MPCRAASLQACSVRFARRRGRPTWSHAGGSVSSALADHRSVPQSSEERVHRVLVADVKVIVTISPPGFAFEPLLFHSGDASRPKNSCRISLSMPNTSNPRPAKNPAASEPTRPADPVITTILTMSSFFIARFTGAQESCYCGCINFLFQEGAAPPGRRPHVERRSNSTYIERHGF